MQKDQISYALHEKLGIWIFRWTPPPRLKSKRAKCHYFKNNEILKHTKYNSVNIYLFESRQNVIFLSKASVRSRRCCWLLLLYNNGGTIGGWGEHHTIDRHRPVVGSHSSNVDNHGTKFDGQTDTHDNQWVWYFIIYLHIRDFRNRFVNQVFFLIQTYMYNNKLDSQNGSKYPCK